MVYTLRDEFGFESQATVDIQVRPVNDPPVPVNDVFVVNESVPKRLDVLANDTDPDGSLEGAIVAMVQDHRTAPSPFKPIRLWNTCRQLDIAGPICSHTASRIVMD